MNNAVEIEAVTWPHKVAYAVSGGKWIPAPHLKLISTALRRVAAGKLKRLMIFLPPRHGKSEMVSKWFPGWYLNMFPDNRVILASYEATYAAFWGNQALGAFVQIRDVLRNGIRLASDKSDWWRLAGHDGYMTTAGIGGPLTGKGCNVGIIDDPIKNQEEAYSKAHREFVWNWYLSTFLTRLEPNGAVILMMTRWHVDDLAGRLLRQQADQWEVINLPAISEIDNDPVGRSMGQALWPERFDVDSLEQIKTDISPRWWSALYQQRPRDNESSNIKREWLPVRPPPSDKPDEVVRAWDFAATEKTSADWTAGAKIGRYGKHWHILDIVRRRVGAGQVSSLVRSVAEQDGRNVRILIEEEPGASGKIATQHIISELAGFAIRKVEPRGDKLIRALPFISQAEGGHVTLSPGAWVEIFIEEAENFPLGEHDDQVDAVSHAFGALFKSNVPQGGFVV